jgi:Leucine-rich repeat (LRR) protein
MKIKKLIIKSLYIFACIFFLSECKNQTPENLSDISHNIKTLEFVNRNLKTLSSEIGKFQDLEKLFLNRNQIKTLPSELWHLKNLHLLNLNNNLLDSVSPEIENLENLESLSLINNNLTKLPSTVTKLKHLKYLNLSNNPIELSDRLKIIKMLPDTEIHFEFASQLNSAADYFKLAVAQYEKKNYEAALFFCEKTINLSPNSADAYSLKGYLECSAKLNDNGCNDLKTAAQLGDKQAPNFIKMYCK